MKLYAPSTIREIQARHDLRLSKSLGQNFLADKNIIDGIIEQSYIGGEDHVIEIGPGIGVITRELCQTAGMVTAIEIDSRLMPVLSETLSDFDNVKVINQDILKTDLHEIINSARLPNGEKPKSAKVIGNLPYYITTPIIMKLLEDKIPVESITIMMQKEVAERIAASPGSKTYGAITVAVAYYCKAVKIAQVPKEVFIPRPKVDSTVLRLDMRKEPPVNLLDEEVFFDCIKAGFGQRRKTLLNSLSGNMGLDKETAALALNEADIDPVRRAETLSIEEFARLANSITKVRS